MAGAAGWEYLYCGTAGRPTARHRRSFRAIKSAKMLLRTARSRKLLARSGHAHLSHEGIVRAVLPWPGPRCRRNDDTSAEVAVTSASWRRTEIAADCPTSLSSIRRELRSVEVTAARKVAGPRWGQTVPFNRCRHASAGSQCQSRGSLKNRCCLRTACTNWDTVGPPSRPFAVLRSAMIRRSARPFDVPPCGPSGPVTRKECPLPQAVP